MKHKLAILASHPIQYQAPLFQKLAEHPDLDVKVYFKKKSPERDAGFGKKVKWDIPLLDGYRYTFLKSFSLKPSSNFWGQVSPGIIKELIKNRYDAILVYGWNSFTNWLAFAAAFLIGTKIFLHSENPLSQELQKSRIKLTLKKFILGPLFKIAGALLYIGEENRKFYKFYGVPDEKLFFMPYAVDNSRFVREAANLKSQIPNLKKKEGIGKNDVVILFVGKFMPKKRPMDLLKAYETVMRNTRMRANIANMGDKEEKIVEKELSYTLTGIFFEIHNELGRFARERQYADALEQKLNEKSIKFKREYGILVVGKKSNIADFIIEDRILVELKRKPTNTGDDYRQVKRYLESANLKLGLLVNFGLEYLKPKRILNSKFKNDLDSLNSHKLADSHYGTHLIFVGDGELRRELEKYAKTVMRNNQHSLNSHKFVDSHYGIHFVGFKNQTELPKHYAIADIFVLPSQTGETWGLVVNEAMCFGLPIIASDIIGCAPDLVRHGENGFVFPSGNKEKLSDSIQDLISNQEKRTRFGNESLKIIQGYNYDKDVEGILSALDLSISG